MSKKGNKPTIYKNQPGDQLISGYSDRRQDKKIPVVPVNDVMKGVVKKTLQPWDIKSTNQR